MQDREPETVEIRSTSRASATVTDIVLRESDLVRLLFRPEIVENPHDVQACVRGTFIYQKRGKNEDWTDVETESLATLKKGDNYQLLIKAGGDHGEALGSVQTFITRQGDMVWTH
jgi:hypothetical protein